MGEDLVFNCSGDLVPRANGSHLMYSLVASFSVGNSDGQNLSLTETFEACNCDSWFRDTHDATAISIIRIITSVFSVLGSASIILSVLLTGKLNTAEVHPLFILSVADFILSILWMIGGIVWLSPGPGGWVSEGADPHTGMCYVLAIATTMAEMVTFFLTTMYALSAFMRSREVYNNKGRQVMGQNKHKRWRYVLTGLIYVASWIIPLIIVLPITGHYVGIDSTNQGCWCIVDFFNLRPDDGNNDRHSHFNQFSIIQASILGAVFPLTTLIVSALYVSTFYYARQVIKHQQREMEEGKGAKLMKTILVRLTFFVIIYLIAGIPTLAASILVWNEKVRLDLSEKPDRAVLFTHAFCAPLQGFLNAIVYGWSRKEFRKAVNLQNKLKFYKGSANYETLNAGRQIPRSQRGSLILDSGRYEQHQT